MNRREAAITMVSTHLRAADGKAAGAVGLGR